MTMTKREHKTTKTKHSPSLLCCPPPPRRRRRHQTHTWTPTTIFSAALFTAHSHSLFFTTTRSLPVPRFMSTVLTRKPHESLRATLHVGVKRTAHICKSHTRRLRIHTCVRAQLVKLLTHSHANPFSATLTHFVCEVHETINTTCAHDVVGSSFVLTRERASSRSRSRFRAFVFVFNSVDKVSTLSLSLNSTFSPRVFFCPLLHVDFCVFVCGLRWTPGGWLDGLPLLLVGWEEVACFGVWVSPLLPTGGRLFKREGEVMRHYASAVVVARWRCCVRLGKFVWSVRMTWYLGNPK